ncbi:MAG: energy transducer TonB [Bacteroidota bacterium]|nr:energy transducer TonB [Bacteroidota bacterium]
MVDQIQYPTIARKAQVEGSVIVQFVVDPEGNVRNAVVTRGIGAGCDEEALRVIRQAKFNPGYNEGAAVNTSMSLPILFKLQ